MYLTSTSYLVLFPLLNILTEGFWNRIESSHDSFEEPCEAAALRRGHIWGYVLLFRWRAVHCEEFKAGWGSVLEKVLFLVVFHTSLKTCFWLTCHFLIPSPVLLESDHRRWLIDMPITSRTTRWLFCAESWESTFCTCMENGFTFSSWRTWYAAIDPQ